MVGLTKFLPLAKQLATYLKLGMDHYATLKMAGEIAGADAVAEFLHGKMESWSPEVNGVELLDTPTRKAAARFLAGVAIQFVRSS